MSGDTPISAMVPDATAHSGRADERLDDVVIGAAPHRRNGAAGIDDTGVGDDAPKPVVDVSQLEFLTVEECAQYLRLDRKTIYSMISRGELPGARRCGRTYRIHRASVVSSFSAKPRPVHHGGKR